MPSATPYGYGWQEMVYFRFNKGWLHMFKIYGPHISSIYPDFEALMNSVVYAAE